MNKTGDNKNLIKASLVIMSDISLPIFSWILAIETKRLVSFPNYRT